MDQRPLLITHRANCGREPENTLASLEECRANGITAIEVDLRLRGADLVLCHDVPGPKAPLLSECLPLLARFPFVMLDIKDDETAQALVRATSTWQHAGDAFVTDPVTSAASDDSPDRSVRDGCLPQAGFAALAGTGVLLAGTNAAALSQLRDATGLPMSISYPADRPGLTAKPALAGVVDALLWLATVSLPLRIIYWRLRYRPAALTLYSKVTSGPALRLARLLGMRTYIWTVNDPDAGERLLRAGASGLITDRIVLLRDRLPSAGGAADERA